MLWLLAGSKWVLGLLIPSTRTMGRGDIGFCPYEVSPSSLPEHPLSSMERAGLANQRGINSGRDKGEGEGRKVALSQSWIGGDKRWKGKITVALTNVANVENTIVEVVSRRVVPSAVMA